MKKRYKGKDYASKKHQMEFPVRANLKIDTDKRHPTFASSATVTLAFKSSISSGNNGYEWFGLHFGGSVDLCFFPLRPADVTAFPHQLTRAYLSPEKPPTTQTKQTIVQHFI
jgi:hypothetical protein